MASDLRAKFNEWIAIFVLLPAALSLFICIFIFWRMLQQNHARMLDDQVAIVGSAFEQTLRAEALRLKTMLNLPAAESLITIAHRRAATSGQVQESKVEVEWKQAKRDDMIVRSALDNDIAILFRQTRDQQKHIVLLSIADEWSAVLASSEKTPMFYQDKNDWWPLVRASKDERIVSEGATIDGKLGLILPRRSEQGTVVAVAREELSLESMIADIAAPANEKDVAVLLVAQDARMITKTTNQIFAAHAAALAEHINASGSPVGWFDGLRYSGRTVDAGVYWARPLWIVAAHAESRTPLSLYAPLAIAVLIGCAAIFGVFAFSRSIGSRLFFEPMREAAEAGIWVLRRAGGNAAELAAGKYAGRRAKGHVASHPWSKIEYKEDTPLHLELNQWLSGVEQDAPGGAAHVSTEMRHDLELATEYQRALMNRAPPQIPEVYAEGRLRLEFAHLYKPAAALGGDFFEIKAVGPDCAGIIIADVAGHGVRSGLLAATLRSLLGSTIPSAGIPPAS